MDLLGISRDLSRRVSKLRFEPPVACVYNPLQYAWKSHAAYLSRYGAAPKEVVLLGMNPGPWGMAQTGVPFGEVSAVRGWLGIEAPVERPDREHPKRPVRGFDCVRSEVSGQRLWGWARDRFVVADKFFEHFFVANYCPLVFMLESGANHTPEKLPRQEREALFDLCDEALRRTIHHLRPRWVIGVGAFAEGRAREALAGSNVQIGGILHPSPASPAANRGWAQAAERQLRALGIQIEQGA